jgi:hypothetical protein
MITEKELLEEFKISRTTLWRLRKMGMPHIKVGSTYRYEKEDVVRWLKNSNALLEKIGYKEIQIDYSSTLEASEAIKFEFFIAVEVSSSVIDKYNDVDF